MSGTDAAGRTGRRRREREAGGEREDSSTTDAAATRCTGTGRREDDAITAVSLFLLALSAKQTLVVFWIQRTQASLQACIDPLTHWVPNHHTTLQYIRFIFIHLLTKKCRLRNSILFVGFWDLNCVECTQKEKSTICY